MADNPQTLYERIGGQAVIAELIHQFYDRVVADPALQPFFEHASMDKIRHMQRQFFSAALDGPITYTGKPLSHVHHGRGITRQHFALYVGHLLETLEGLEINETDVQDIIGRINTYAGEITGDPGSLG
jgi:hemoglobin